MKKLEYALNHICSLTISYKGFYQNISIEELYDRMGILSLNQMIAECNLFELFSVVKSKRPILLFDAFVTEQNRFSTRTGDKMTCTLSNPPIASFYGRVVIYGIFCLEKSRHSKIN